MMYITKCVKCGVEIDATKDNFCEDCGTPIAKFNSNYCENPDCLRSQSKFEIKPDKRYCGLCGELTTYGKEIESML